MGTEPRTNSTRYKHPFLHLIFHNPCLISLLFFVITSLIPFCVKINEFTPRQVKYYYGTVDKEQYAYK
jgi:hypothetical protein